MTTAALGPRILFGWPSRKPASPADDTAQEEDANRRKIMNEMIAAGACESEYGVQMLMSVFPGKF